MQIVEYTFSHKKVEAFFFVRGRRWNFRVHDVEYLCVFVKTLNGVHSFSVMFSLQSANKSAGSGSALVASIENGEVNQWVGTK